MTHTEADFDRLSWHDCHIWGIEFRAGDPDEGDWTSELVLDLDYIVGWIRDTSEAGRFRVAPATLVFHGVSDPRISIDWGRAGTQISLHAVSIGSVDREPVPMQRVYLDRPYYRWTLRLNWPDGEIAFGAVGFTQTLRGEPVVTEKQWLPRARSRLSEG